MANNEFRDITPEGVTDGKKKYRHFQILRTLILSLIVVLIFGVIFLDPNDDIFNMFMIVHLTLIITCFVLLVYAILMKADKELVNLGSSDQKFFCTETPTYKRQIIWMTIAFIMTLLFLILAITTFDYSTISIIEVIAALLAVIVSLWGLYKLGQKKTCDEFPTDWQECPE